MLRQVLTLRLQGFIFFATADRLRATVIDLLIAKQVRNREVKWLIMDFHSVENIDTSAAKKFKKILTYCDNHGVIVVLTDVPQGAKDQLEQDDVTTSNFPNLAYMEDLDEGVEWCCDEMLKTHCLKFNLTDRSRDKHTFPSIVNGLLMYLRVGFERMVVGEAFDSVSFREAGTKRTFNKGDIIAEEQDHYIPQEAEMYYIAKGACSQHHKSKFGERTLDKRYAGCLVGELYFFLKQPRRESIIAEKDGTEVYAYTQVRPPFPV